MKIKDGIFLFCVYLISILSQGAMYYLQAHGKIQINQSADYFCIIYFVMAVAALHSFRKLSFL
ncbi:MAG: hypothetical protein K8Q92_04450 [Methylophilales bacterium]|nr:hypothetical protein [Methylophilales bacterium]